MPDIVILFIVISLAVIIVSAITDKIESNLEKEYGRY